MGEGMYASRLASSRRATDDHVRHVALLGDYLQAVQRVLVSYNLGCKEVRGVVRSYQYIKVLVECQLMASRDRLGYVCLFVCGHHWVWLAVIG